MKILYLILLIVLPFSLFSQNFKTRCKFKNADETLRLTNVRCSHAVQCEFKKVKQKIPGLSEKALLGKFNDFYIALDNPGKAYKGSARFNKILVNIKGKKNFKPSPYVLDVSNYRHFKKCRIDNKDYTFVINCSRYLKLEGSTEFVSVSPIQEASLNIGGTDVKIMATSVNLNLDFEPEIDKLVIHEKGTGTDFYAGIYVRDIALNRPFKYGRKREWYKLVYHKEDHSLEVVKAEPSFGYIKSNVKWNMILKPGDASFGGKANEKVRVPVGEYKIYYWTSEFGKFSVGEFDHKDWSSKKWVKVWPKINIKKDQTYIAKPLNKVKCWYRKGFYKNEFAVVLGLTNAHGAGNMGIGYNGRGLEYKFKLIDKASGDIISQGKMHEG